MAEAEEREMRERDLRCYTRSRSKLLADCTTELKLSADLLADHNSSYLVLARKLSLLNRFLTDLRNLNAQIMRRVPEAQAEAEIDFGYDHELPLKRGISDLAIAVELAELARSQANAPSLPPPPSRPVTLPKTVRLPEIHIEKFSGDYLKFHEFWDLFNSTIAKHALDDVEKLNYLKTFLEGEAREFLRGYNLETVTYTTICEAFKARFGRPQLAIFSHLCTMINMPVLETHDVRKLQASFDEFECHVRSLVSQGLSEDTFGTVFTAVLLCKLPKFVRMELYRKNGSADWTLDSLRSLLCDEIRAREMSEVDFVQSHQPKSSSASNAEKRFDYKSKGKPGQPTASVLAKPVSSAGDSQSKGCSCCVFCGKSSHDSESCREYPDARVRRKKVSGSCFLCFGNHMVQRCNVPSTLRCRHCQRRHHSSLCYDHFPSPETDLPDTRKAETRVKQFVPTNTTITHSSYTSLQTALVSACNCVGLFRVEARLLFDTGSSRTYITQDCAKRLRATVIDKEVVSSAGFGDNRRRMQNFDIVEFDICLLDGSKLRVRASVAPVITCPVEKQPLDLLSYPLLASCHLAEPLVASPSMLPIDILVGNDFHYMFMDGPFIMYSDGMVFLPSKVGYLTAGISPSVPSNKPHQLCTLLTHGQPASFEDAGFQLERFWRLDDIGITDKPSTTEEEVALKHFTDNVSRAPDGRYQVRWPWRDRVVDLPDNKTLAKGRLISLLRRIDPQVILRYHATIIEQLQKQIIEVAPAVPSGDLVHYIPHHCVITPAKKTTKLRIVYDASAKAHRNAPSLNDCMHTGPLILAELVGILVRLRLSPVVVTADIEKAFLQIELKVEDRDTTRFFWVRDPEQPFSPQNMVIYRFRRVLFGAKGSPFLLSATVRAHVLEYPCCEETKVEIERNRFVDNVFLLCDDDQQALKMYTEAKAIFCDARMNLREWYCNRSSVRDKVSAEDRVDEVSTKVLGVEWDTRDDVLSCAPAKVSDQPVTKRILLREISGVFDKCGWFSPITLRGKAMIQELWKSKIGWDDLLSPELQAGWSKTRSDLSGIHLMLQRRFLGDNISPLSDDLELHCFTDASQLAYAAVVFVRHSQSGKTSCANVFAKARVAPVKNPLTIPKLELMGVLIGTRMLSFLQVEITLPIKRIFLWCDSQCVLHWLRKESISTVFVANRLKEIRKHSNISFRYVPTECNPADIASRGSTLSELTDSSLWWSGPGWLSQDESKWPAPFFDNSLSPSSETAVDSEQPGNECMLLLPDISDSFVLPMVLKCSTLGKLRRVVAWMFRFIRNCRSRGSRSVGPLVADEIRRASVWLDCQVQRSFLPRQLDKYGNKAKQLQLFRDKEGLIRSQTRFELLELSDDNVAPKLLPKNCPYTDLVIRDCHATIHHGGPRATLAEIRQEYWIPSGMSRVKEVLKTCHKCRRAKGGSFRLPPYPPLPEFRGRRVHPFSVVGVDYLGPLFVRGAASEQSKVWICLFTCAVVRAVHLEVVPELSAEHFLLALRRFVSLRTCPTLIISHNAKNFVASHKLLDGMWNEVCSSDAVVEFCATSGIAWKFVTERAPWMGGFYERMIGLTKNCLKTCLGKSNLTGIELQTVAYEVVATLNKRPLLPVDADSSEVLTPAHFLMQQLKTLPEAAGDSDGWSPSKSAIMSHLVVTVGADHSLSRLAYQPEGIYFNNKMFRSIEMIFWYLVLKNAGHRLLAKTLRRNARLRKNPGEIRAWCAEQGFVPSAAVIFGAPDIYKDILMFFCHKKERFGPIVFSFLDVIADVGDNEVDLINFKCTNANARDFVWSTGVRNNAFDNDHFGLVRSSGFNLYGEVLKQVAVKIRERETMKPRWGVRKIQAGQKLSHRYRAPQTVCLLSDSICREVDHIECGLKIHKGGGLFRDLVDMVKADPSVNLLDFNFLIVHCGINDVQRGKREADASWFKMLAFLKDLVREGFPATRILVSLPIPHPGVSGVDDFSAFIMDTLYGTHMRVVDWSAEPGRFVGENGLTNWYYYDQDDFFHLRHSGFRCMWERWCEFFPVLRSVRYRLRAKKKAIRRRRRR